MYKISYNLMPSLQITCSIVCMKPKLWSWGQETIAHMMMSCRNCSFLEKYNSIFGTHWMNM